MQYNKAIEELVVPLDRSRDLIPAIGVDGATIEQLFKLKYAVSHAAFICANRSPETLHGFACAFVVGNNLQRFRVGSIVENRPWCKSSFEEAPCRYQSVWRFSHAYCAAY